MSPLTSIVLSDCVSGSVADMIGPLGSVFAKLKPLMSVPPFWYPTKADPLCTKMSASKLVSYHNVPSSGSVTGAIVFAS